MNDAKKKAADPSQRPSMPEPANGPAAAGPPTADAVPVAVAASDLEQRVRDDLAAHRREVDAALRGSNER